MASRRRGVPIAALVLGLLLLALAAASEFRALAWWSKVRLPPVRSSPDQAFVTLSRGQLRIGSRGTAGFFTRAIAHPGLAITHPDRVLSDHTRRLWLPQRYQARQTRGLVGSSRVDLQACKLEYSIVSPK